MKWVHRCAFSRLYISNSITICISNKLSIIVISIKNNRLEYLWYNEVFFFLQCRLYWQFSATSGHWLSNLNPGVFVYHVCGLYLSFILRWQKWSILLATCRWQTRGSSINLLSNPTPYTITDLVVVRYLRHPIKLL